MVRTHGHVLEAGRAEQSRHLVAAEAALEGRREAVELVVDADAERIVGVGLQGEIRGEPSEPRTPASDPIRHDEDRVERRSQRIAHEMQDGMRNADGYAADMVDAAQQAAVPRHLRPPVDVDMYSPAGTSQLHRSAQRARRVW